MSDIYNYIEKNTTKIDEINTLDALILARLSYVHFENILDKLPMTIKELNKYLEEIKTNKLDTKLVNMLASSPRFQNLEIERCKCILDQEKEEQFLAITIRVKDNTIFISFRGTNKNIIGYKEDMNMSYMTIPSQIDAVKYVNEEHASTIYLGGHSKGGNLSMYAGVHANFLKKCYIKKIFNFDGPGFLKIDQKFQKMKKKIINYFPETSIVGMLLENDAEVIPIKTNKKGIEAHNLYTWEINDDKLVEGTLSKNSMDFYLATKKLNENILINRRKAIIDYFFKLVMQGKINGLKNIDLNEIKSLLDNSPIITKEEKKVLLNYIKSFVKVSLPTIKKEKKLT